MIHNTPVLRRHLMTFSLLWIQTSKDFGLLEDAGLLIEYHLRRWWRNEGVWLGERGQNCGGVSMLDNSRYVRRRLLEHDGMIL